MHQLQLGDNGRQNQMGVQQMYQHMLAIPKEDGGFMWVREDQLDHLPDDVALAIMQSQPHMSGIRDWWARRKDRKALQKEEKWQTKEARRAQRSERKGGTFMERFGRMTEGVVGKFTDGQEGMETRGGLPQFTGGLDIGVAKWWQNPMVMGVGALVLIGGIWMISRTMKK